MHAVMYICLPMHEHIQRMLTICSKTQVISKVTGLEHRL